MLMAKSILIIGAGIGGLSAGCYAQRNGFRSEIFEMNANAGGLCTSWKRKEFTFDGCIHWLVGTQPGSAFYKLWEEIGAVQGKDFYYYDYFTRYTDLDGHEFVAYGDPDKFCEHLISISPEDEKLIRRFTRDIKTIMRQDMPVDYNLKTGIQALPSLFLFLKYRMPLSKFAAKFKSPLLRKLFIEALDWHDMPAIFIFWTLALMGGRKAGYPIGGSTGLISSIVHKYEELGGTVRYNKKVETILVENDQAVGVRFSDGTEQRADYILSAADGHRTIFGWLGGKYANASLRKHYETLPLFPCLVYISLGLNHDYTDEPYGFQYQLKKPVTIGSDEMKAIGVRNHWFDPTLRPERKSILTIMLQQDYKYWEALKDDRQAYLAEKARIGEQVLSLLEDRYPDIRSHVEVMDISTPLTFERYTGNWKASYEGWLMTPKNITLQLPQKLPGLENFYMAGHWISPGGGLPAGLLTGRNAIKKICRKENSRFK
jgi:phytoene dehydrogenase-like protein